MKQFIVLSALMALCACGRLDSKYIPANQVNGYNQNFNTGSYQKQIQEQYNGPINKAANDVPILKLDNENNGETYNFAAETGDGISVHEQGDARGDGTNAQGGYFYTAPDGQQIQVEYTAGETGFVARGSHIPTPPPVPVDIQKAVEQNLADEAKGIFDDGQYREEHDNNGAHIAYGNYVKTGTFNGNYREQVNSASNNQFNFQGDVKKQYVPPTLNNGGYNY